jgi:hypothetical protein
VQRRLGFKVTLAARLNGAVAYGGAMICFSATASGCSREPRGRGAVVAYFNFERARLGRYTKGGTPAEVVCGAGRCPRGEPNVLAHLGGCALSEANSWPSGRASILGMS